MPIPRTPRSSRPRRPPPGSGRNPNGITTRMTTTAWATSGTNSFSARPMNNDDRVSGVTRRRSWEPPCRSYWRFDPVPAVPKSEVMTRIPGTNHAHGDPCVGAVVVAISGPKSSRKNSGWISPATRENGSLATGRSSRPMTMRMSPRALRRGAVEVVVVMVWSPVVRRLFRRALRRSRLHHAGSAR